MSAAKASGRESIQIKTHDSEQAEAALELAAEAKRLSGLPQAQGPHDLDPQLESRRVETRQLGGWENKQVVGVKDAETLAGIMQAVIFQAPKADWLFDLAGKEFSIRADEMGGEQAAQDQQMRDEALLDLETEIVAVDEKMSQIIYGVILNEEGNRRGLVESEKNPRLAVRLDLQAQIEGEVMVIYRRRYTFEIVSEALKGHLPVYIGLNEA